MTVSLELGVALIALVFSAAAYASSRRARSADTFAKLYDQFSEHAFGEAMERIANWARSVEPSDGHSTSRKDIRLAYRSYLADLQREGLITKRDDLEAARRTVKAWFLKCLHHYRFGDLPKRHLLVLVGPPKAWVMWNVFDMTREQAAVVLRGQGLGEPPEVTRAESDFRELERLTGRSAHDRITP